jgi:SAM-dependent methyltransferase
MRDPKHRFSTRVENYSRYRPSYPLAILELLAEHCGLVANSVVADLGSGTGILARLFLEYGNPVFGVEPNREMREAGERLLARHSRFTSVEGSAEVTTLATACVDYVTAGQAFHWFDVGKARAEAARILRPGGWVVLVWNERRTSSTPFLEAYERLLRTFGTDYERVSREQVDPERIRAFFAPAPFEAHTFENFQHFDLEGLRGRLLSSSYTPEPEHPNHAPMLVALEALFRDHESRREVTFEYDTRVYIGQLGEN